MRIFHRLASTVTRYVCHAVNNVYLAIQKKIHLNINSNTFSTSLVIIEPITSYSRRVLIRIQIYTDAQASFPLHSHRCVNWIYVGRNNLSNIRNRSIHPLRHHAEESLLSPCAVVAVRFMLFTLITFWVYIYGNQTPEASAAYGGTSSRYPTCNRHYNV